MTNKRHHPDAIQQPPLASPHAGRATPCSHGVIVDCHRAHAGDEFALLLDTWSDVRQLGLPLGSYIADAI